MAEGKRRREVAGGGEERAVAPRYASAVVAKRLLADALAPRAARPALRRGEAEARGAAGRGGGGGSHPPRWARKRMRVRRVGKPPGCVVGARSRERLVLREEGGGRVEVSEAELMPVLPEVGGRAWLLDDGGEVEVVRVGEEEGRVTVRLPPGEGGVLLTCSRWDLCEVQQ
ncbi:hypothetical protein AB1Y20_002449 [Prymnesium parvum]|uniref:Uncharacterized protein n=1 Tax=Prymnesium parvum TaxID=97485 RepID=A0AB34J900_PRYPA